LWTFVHDFTKLKKLKTSIPFATLSQQQTEDQLTQTRNFAKGRPLPLFYWRLPPPEEAWNLGQSLFCLSIPRTWQELAKKKSCPMRAREKESTTKKLAAPNSQVQPDAS
jgi:hypothetical protein